MLWVLLMKEKEIQKILKEWEPNGAKRIAVENFLATIDITDHESHMGTKANLMMDANLYRWNWATCMAISEGIKKSYENIKERDNETKNTQT